MTTIVARTVRQRANFCCEYCQMLERLSELPFEIDHIIAEQHGGKSVAENLALCCGFCNRHKGPNIAGIDTESGALIPLFHPRRDRWADHFKWRDENLVGLTAIGRVTVAVLAINHPAQRAVRQALIAEGAFPQS